jgi:anion-transporting  ArsA/GET3 family ATPase
VADPHTAMPPTPAAPPAGVGLLVEGRRVIVCAGAGGVGKTTIAAAIALEGARRGLNVLCLTIDPAKRLADSLGIRFSAGAEHAVTDEQFRAAGLDVAGSLVVMMLDTKRTFDELIARHAPSPEVRDRILGNRFYRYVSTSLAGTQAYMAMEKVLSVKDDARFDLIVLDTPPTSDALDFLDAPERLIEALDSAAMRWIVDAFERSGKLGLNLVARGVATVLRGIGKLTGRGFLEHMAEFLAELNDMFGGFKERAARVASAFRSPEFAYVLVTAPVPAALDEARYFRARLEQSGMVADAIIVNRVHRVPLREPAAADVRAVLAEIGLALDETISERLLRALRDEATEAAVEQKELTRAGLLSGAGAPVGLDLIEVPAMAGDVHDLAGLARVSRAVFRAPQAG